MHIDPSPDLPTPQTLLANGVLVVALGRTETVFGTRLLLGALSGWAPLARLAYPASIMKLAESWGWGVCTVAAGLLPSAERSVAAAGAAFNIYGVRSADRGAREGGAVRQLCAQSQAAQLVWPIRQESGLGQVPLGQ
jgi:hypothetical protein